MFEEKYKGKTVGEINQAIETLSKALSTASDPREREQIQAEIDYLNTFDRSAPISNWEAIKKEETAESILANSPKTSQELIENAPNTLTKGLQAKGNRGDNKVAMKYDPSYHDAKSTAEVKAEQEANNADNNNTKTKTETVEQNILAKDVPQNGGEGENNHPTNHPTKQENKGRYKSSMYGILDAMRNGDIDKSTGLYFILDALSKAARNTGIDIGNIGAQFTGGTVRNDYQDSLWNQRRGKMFENEMSSELNQQSGTDKELEYSLGKEDLIGKGLSNEQADLALNASRTFNDKAEQFRAAGNDTLADLYALVGSAATRKVGPEELAAIAVSGVLNTPEGKAAADEILNMAKNLMQTGADAVGGLNTIVSFLTGNK